MPRVWSVAVVCLLGTAASAGGLRRDRTVLTAPNQKDSAPKLRRDARTVDANRTNVTDFSSTGMRTSLTQAEMCAVAAQYNPGPTLCPLGAGQMRFPLPTMQARIAGFVETWAAMQKEFPVQCCMGVNHLFAVYHAVTELQPPVVIESGVAAGHTTWMLRRLLPAARIFAHDPTGPATYAKEDNMAVARGWIDENPNTTYLTQENFQDLARARWDELIPDAADRARTFVLLDDHQSSVERIKMLRRWGFRHLFYEDNYPFNMATSADKYTCPNLPPAILPRTYTIHPIGDAYSPNSMCQPVPPGTTSVLYKDRFGTLCTVITLQAHVANLAFLQASMKSYFEYPALFSPCAAATRPTVLATTPPAALGLPPAVLPPGGGGDLWFYGHYHPALIELHPVIDPDAELAAAIAAADKVAESLQKGT